jgi:hypothetical protein
MRHQPRRPSPALAISLLALFVALGGSAYAAAAINGKNIKNGTVTGKKLKNRSVGGTKIKLNGIGGRAVKESSLGTVPNATRASTAGRADTAGSADSATSAGDAAELGGQGPAAYAKAGLEAPHLLGTPGNPQLQDDWAVLAGTVPAGFWKDQFGVVFMQGALDAAADPADNVVAFTLPPGYRPPDDVLFAGRESFGPDAETEDCRVVVFPNGNVNVRYIGDVSSCVLNGIFYRAAG